MNILIEKDFYTPQKEIQRARQMSADYQLQTQKLNEIFDKNLSLRPWLSLQYLLGVEELQRIFEVLQSESTTAQGDLPTSSVAVEMAIARCISGCLQDIDPQRRDAELVFSFLRDYKVVQPLQGKSHSVSLSRVHAILQDNYEDSLLCGLFNLLLSEFMNSTTKVITF